MKPRMDDEVCRASRGPIAEYFGLDPEMVEGWRFRKMVSGSETKLGHAHREPVASPLLANVYLHYVFRSMGGGLAQESGPEGAT